MKKVFLIIVLTITGLINAQKINFGVKTGINLANLTGDGVRYLEQQIDFTMPTNMKTGFYIGGYINVPIVDKIYFQPEILVSTQGAKYNGNGYTDVLDLPLDGALAENVKLKLDGKMNLTYLNIPLMMQYKINNLKLELGPQIGFLLSAKENVDANIYAKTTYMGVVQYISQSQNIERNIKNKFNSIDLGLNIGATYEFKNGLNFGARYNLGLTNLPSSDNEKAKNSVISLGVGYTFSKK